MMGGYPARRIVAYTAPHRGLSLAANTVREFDPLSLYLFKQEFRALADVRHPNLVRFYEFVQRDDGEVFFTMERVYGVDFFRYVRETTVDFVRLRRALRQLVEGVSAVHAAGKLHRDVKPSNVLVTGEGRVVLLDFGVSTQLVTRSSTLPILPGLAARSRRALAGLGRRQGTRREALAH